eukprot:jgi/Tetstr1/454273/TSEL_041192.t1
MGAGHSRPVLSAELEVLVEFEDPAAATRCVTVHIPRMAKKIGLRSVIHDGDIVRMRLCVDGLSAAHLHSIKRAIVGHSTGRPFVKSKWGRYMAWHSKPLSAWLRRHNGPGAAE